MRRLILLLLVTAILLAGCSYLPFGEREEIEADRMDPDQNYSFSQLKEFITTGGYQSRTAVAWQLEQQVNLKFEERAELLLIGLEHEINKPSQEQVPAGIYLNSSDYFRLELKSILLDLGHDVKPILQDQLKKESGEMRDHLVIALAYLGDKNMLRETGKILLESDSLALQISAASALARLNDPEGLNYLETALVDSHEVVTRSCTRNLSIYPVREAAASALIDMGYDVERQGDHFTLVR